MACFYVNRRFFENYADYTVSFDRIFVLKVLMMGDHFMIKKCVSIVFTVMIGLLVCCTARAESSVTYDGKKFIFSSQDLFENFKSVMPGDEIIQKITINNTGSKSIDLFVRQRLEKDSTEFLSKLVLKNLDDPDTNLLESSRTWICLGTFEPGPRIISFQLSVPKELDNSYAGKIGFFEWGFRSEDTIKNASSDEDAIIPISKTGDTSNVKLWISLAVVSLAAIFLLFILKKKNKRNF